MARSIKKKVFKKSSITDLLNGLSDKIDKLTDKLKSNFKLTILEKAAGWFTILGTIVSFFFAGLGIYLTQKYGESDAKITELQTIAANQACQTNQVIEIVKKLETQDGLTREQLDLIKKSDRREEDEIRGKKVRSKEQVLIVYNEVVDSLKKYSTNGGVIVIKINEPGYKESWNQRRKNLIKRLIIILRDALDNDYIKENKELQALWRQYLDLVVSEDGSSFYSDPDTYDDMDALFRRIHHIMTEFLSLEDAFRKAYK